MDKLETDITNLRGECDIMSERVTDLTGGKGNVYFIFNQLTQHTYFSSEMTSVCMPRPIPSRKMVLSERHCIRCIKFYKFSF